MTDPLRVPNRRLTKADADAIAAIKPVPHGMPSQPFSRVRALWLCRVCSWWNAPDRATCKDCGAAPC
jgi:hypothetical protein